jgi:hypothetical protein
MLWIRLKNISVKNFKNKVINLKIDLNNNRIKDKPNELINMAKEVFTDFANLENPIKKNKLKIRDEDEAISEQFGQKLEDMLSNKQNDLFD